MKRMFPMILLFALLLCVPVRADELTLDAPLRAAHGKADRHGALCQG